MPSTIGHEAQIFRAAIAALLIARCAAQLWLERLNRRFVLTHSASVPEAFRGIIDEPTFQKSNAYTLAKNKLSQLDILLDNMVLALVLFTGALPFFYFHFVEHFGVSSLSLAAFIFVVGLALSLFDLPLSWYSQFRLEQRFGFNTTTKKPGGSIGSKPCSSPFSLVIHSFCWCSSSSIGWVIGGGSGPGSPCSAFN